MKVLCFAKLNDETKKKEVFLVPTPFFSKYYGIFRVSDYDLNIPHY